MSKNLLKTLVSVIAAISLVIGLSACNKEESKPASNSEKTEKEIKSADSQKGEALKNNIKLSSIRGTVRNEVQFTVSDLKPNSSAELIWNEVDGKYNVKGVYEVIGPEFTEKDVTLVKGTSNANGVWEGSFKVPEGFGGDYTIYVKEDNKKVGQTAYTVDPTFVMTPTSGPVGTEITVKVEGLGWSTYMRNWQLTYDNKYTGLVTAISTNGTAEAKFRAAGTPGKHAIRLRTGYLGMQYINYLQSPYPDKPAPDFMFEITGEEAVAKNYVEPAPTAADGGVKMPELKNKSGVEVALNKTEGEVGEAVNMTAKGLPKDKKVDIVWNTMKGSRVSGLGFSETSAKLQTVTTNSEGGFTYEFKVPDDLGGSPHRIDLKVGNEVYGQGYLRILPSIVKYSPTSGPVGTKIQITIKGGGWTEFDNAYYLTYDNAYTGYL
ncbi:hypothetical protein [Bacillus massiliigorillae]|uniref:hypothetical protein n=1 Tax=Bacillus massiliigorillae TaxID=1243664 RepID=UPI0005A9E915|nr:hypothetical protein [Bacillus massiliigorillae]